MEYSNGGRGELLARAVNYVSNGRYSKAVAIIKKEIAKDPSKEAYMTLGCAYLGLGQDMLAREAFHTAVYSYNYMNKNSSGVYSEAICNLGMTYYYYEDDTSAMLAYRYGLENKPTWDLMWNYANVLLRQYMSGKYASLSTCWQLYESRFKMSDPIKLGSNPNWTGGVFVDSITVLAEQGAGDAIMFARYLPEVKKWCNRIVVECEESLNCMFPGYSTRNFRGHETTHAIPMCSLGNLLDYIPSGSYLGGWVGGSDRIVGVWQSLQKHNNALYRNCPVEDMLLTGINCSIGPDCIDPRLPHLPSSTWEETISSLKTAKLVISVDTAIVHLCGAMGVPCLVLMPTKNSDWRWGDSSCGSSNQWYPSVKVIRNKGNWTDTCKEINAYYK